MKLESMAQFLIIGDLILHNRKKYEVMDVSTFGDTTTILYKEPKANQLQGVITANKSEFIKIISKIPMNKD